MIKHSFKLAFALSFLMGAISAHAQSTNETTTLTSSLNPSIYGQSVIFTATVNNASPGGGTPTGTITFKDGATVMGTGTLNASGVATTTNSALSSATHSITASYGGDISHPAGTSSILAQTVNTGCFLFEGLEHCPLGTSTLIVVTNKLFIANLRDSGQDGVTISLGQTPGWEGSWQPLDDGSLPLGAYLRAALSAHCNGASTCGSNGVMIATMSAVKGSNTVELWTEYPAFGGTTLRYEFYRNGILVGTTNRQAIQPLQISAFPTGSRFDGYLANYKWDTNSPAIISPAGLILEVDTVRVIPEGTNGVVFNGPYTLTLVAAKVQSFTIILETLRFTYAGLKHTLLGNARVSAVAVDPTDPSAIREFTLEHLGTNSEDGVTINWGDETPDFTDFDLFWNQFDPNGMLANGAYLNRLIIGSGGTVTNGYIGLVKVTKMGVTNYVISTDFQPIGASLRTVEVFRQGLLLARLTGQGGPIVATLSSWPTSWHLNHPPLSTGLGSSVLVDIAVTGGATVRGDFVLITPEGPVSTGFPTAVRITASQIPAINFTAESVAPLILHMIPNGKLVTLQWFGSDFLQESDDLVTWADVPGATSPFPVAPARTHHFYRIHRIGGGILTK